ncbi:hypothetical protein BGZ57DRAFT_726763, partial [Hyaloscypha finlandica]
AASVTRQTNAVVVSAGLMEKTVKVRVGVQKWNNHIGKHFNRSRNILVHDPNSSLRIGDVISISPGWRASKQVNHVVNSILAPFGEPIENRPPVPTLEERLGMREEKRRAREERRKAKRREEVAGVESERVKGGEGKEGGENVVQATRVQEVKEAEE